MTNAITPKMADVVLHVTDEHKRVKLLQLLNTLFENSMTDLRILPRAENIRVILTLKEGTRINNTLIPSHIHFIVKKAGILEFDSELNSPVLFGGFCNEVTVDGPNYIFIRNGVTFDFTAPLEKTISSDDLLQTLEKK